MRKLLSILKRLMVAVSCAFAICGLIVALSSGCKALYNEFLQDYEIVIWDEKFPTIVECSYPFGSIFNKDKISFRESEAIIFKRHFWGDDVITLPYIKIKEISLKEGFYWKSMTVKREGFWGKELTFYFKKKQTKDLIKIVLNSVAPEMVIIEKRTLIRNIGINREFSK